MADNTNDILYMKGRFGHRPTYLTQNLGKFECKMLFCPKCKGILREAVTVMGNIVCLNCSDQPSFPTNPIRETVDKLSIRCPLKDNCDWNGVLNQASTHVEKCGNFRVPCYLNCGAILTRKDVINHVRNKCNNRLMNCEHCLLTIKFYFLQAHYSRCPSYPLECRNLCGNKIPRSQMEKHVTIDCPLTYLPCPLKCQNTFRRKDLKTHTDDNCELRLVPCKYCIKDIRFKYLEPHALLRCLQYPLLCPNFCKFEMPRCELENHLNTDCPLADVTCPFTELGCTVSNLKRNGLRNHQKEFYIEHQELLLEDRKILNRKLIICLFVFAVILGFYFAFI